MWIQNYFGFILLIIYILMQSLQIRINIFVSTFLMFFRFQQKWHYRLQQRKLCSPMFFIRAHSQNFPLIKSPIRYHWMMINSIIMFSDVQLKRQILTCFTALGKLSTVTLCLTDVPPLGRRRLQNPGEYRFLSVLYSLWPKIDQKVCCFLAFLKLRLHLTRLTWLIHTSVLTSIWNL